MNVSSPADQTQSPPPSKRLLLTQVLTAFLFIVLPLMGFFAGLKLSPRLNSSPAKPVVSPSATNPTPSPADASENQRLIIGRFNGQVALFTAAAGDSQPHFVGLGEYDGSNPYKYGEPQKVNFDQVTNVQEILFQKKYVEITSFLTNRDQTILYLSTHSYRDNGSGIGQIWKIDLNEPALEWLADSPVYHSGVSDHWIVAIITRASDKYLELSLLTGWGTEGRRTEENYKAILDIAHLTFIPLGHVGNVIINDKTDTVTFQRLAWFTEVCSGEYMCDEGKTWVRQPQGKIYTQYLPFDLPLN